MKVGEKVAVIGRSKDLWIKDFYGDVNTFATVLEEPKANAKKVRLRLWKIGNLQNVDVWVRLAGVITKDDDIDKLNASTKKFLIKLCDLLESESALIKKINIMGSVCDRTLVQKKARLIGIKVEIKCINDEVKYAVFALDRLGKTGIVKGLEVTVYRKAVKDSKGITKFIEKTLVGWIPKAYMVSDRELVKHVELNFKLNK